MNRYFYKSACSLLGFCIAASIGGCGTEKQKEFQEKEIRVTVENVTKRIFRRQIPVQGTVSPVRHAVISARISGTLGLLEAGEGDIRKKGDRLFGIDQQILKNQVMVREADIKVKESELASAKVKLETAEISGKKARLDYERFSRLLESKVATAADFESYETEYKKAQALIKDAHAAIANAEAQLQQAQANLVIARKNLADSVALAPFDCTVVEQYVEKNEYVTVGQDILKLEDQNDLEIVCNISAVYYDMVVPGKTAVRFQAGGMDKGNGIISYKSPSIDPASRTFELKAPIPRESRMVSGMLCDLQIILEEKEAFGLPADALLLRSGDRHIVYAVNDENRAESITVTRGIVDGKFCEITNAGELKSKRIVVSGQTFVNAGTLLKIVNGD